MAPGFTGGETTGTFGTGENELIYWKQGYFSNSVKDDDEFLDRTYQNPVTGTSGYCMCHSFRLSCERQRPNGE